MRKLSIVLAAIFALSLTQVQAQWRDKLIPHFGFMLEYPQGVLAGTESGVGLPSYYSFQLGAYMALAQKNDIVSVGPQANLQLGGNFIPIRNRVRFAYHFQLPVYAMVRVGANSTTYNQQAIGLAVGVGGSYNALSYYSNFGSTIGNVRLNYFNPAAVVEVHINTRGQQMVLRGHASLLRNSGVIPQRRDINGNQLQPGSALDMGYIGFGIVSSL